jgi:hypothetical protein
LRWPTGPGKDIEFIHKGHRYAVVWPSIHPDTGDRYNWVDQSRSDESPPPNDDELAWMPDEWQIRFTGGEQRREQDIPQRKATEAERTTCLTDGPICYAATKALNKFEDRLTVQARHDSALRTVMALVRLGEQGHKGVNSAIADLKDRFVNLVSKDRADGSEGSEYERMVDGGIVKVCADPTAPENKGCCGSNTGQPSEIRPLNLPEEFWNSRRVLQHIRQTAHSRGRSADAVLYTTLARISAMADPRLRFENCLGEGSINLFVAAIGKSGRGKSTAASLAKTLIRTPFNLTDPGAFRDSIGLGSGEGLAELYMGYVYEDDTSRPPKKDGTYYKIKVKRKLRDNAFVYVDEGQTLNQQGKRQGNIVLPTIRSAWNGETLGQSNAREETTRHLPAGSYSLGMVIGYQKDTAQELVGDTAPGTPQRFLFGSATTRRCRSSPPEHPGYLDINLDGGGKITFYHEINGGLWQQNHAKVTGVDTTQIWTPMNPAVQAVRAALPDRRPRRGDAGRSGAGQNHVRHQQGRYGRPGGVRQGEVPGQGRRLRGRPRHPRSPRIPRQEERRRQCRQERALWLYGYVKDHGVVTLGDAKRNAAGRACSTRR